MKDSELSLKRVMYTRSYIIGGDAVFFLLMLLHVSTRGFGRASTLLYSPRCLQLQPVQKQRLQRATRALPAGFLQLMSSSNPDHS